MTPLCTLADGDKVDLIYGEKRWRAGDRFCEAQSVCNLGELFLQVVALYLLRKGAYSEAALVIIVTQAFTLWKTVLYCECAACARMQTPAVQMATAGYLSALTMCGSVLCHAVCYAHMYLC